jgi:hypothetical protein
MQLVEQVEAMPSDALAMNAVHGGLDRSVRRSQDCGIFRLPICGPSKGGPLLYECPGTNENIVPVARPTRPYEAPAVVTREEILGLLSASGSDGASTSDRN